MPRSIVPLPPQSIGRVPLQLPFLRGEHEHAANSIGIWDLTPWLVLYTKADDRLGGKFLDSISRSFEARGRSYRLTLNPARIKHADGTETDEFPGEREALVEMALRKIATQRQTMVVDRETVAVSVGIYELRAELSRTGHAMRYGQIEEALRILNGAQVEIKRVETDVDGDQIEVILSSTIFPTMALKKFRRKEESTTAYIQFNGLITDAIRGLDFHEINYTLLMSLRPVPRWIYKRLLHEVMFGGPDRRLHEISAASILESCGMGSYKRPRDAFDKITGFLTELQNIGGVIERFSVEKVEEGSGRERRIVDLRYTVEVTEDFFRSAEKAMRGSVARIEDFQAVTKRTPKDGWVMETPAIRTGLQRRQAARSKVDQLKLI